MLELPGSNRNLFGKRDRLIDVLDHKSGKLSDAIASMRDRLFVWKKFKKEPVGRSVMQLVDPIVEMTNVALTMSIRELFKCGHIGMPTEEEANEYRAEMRGYKKAWLQIRNDPAALEAELERLQLSETQPPPQDDVDVTASF